MKEILKALFQNGLYLNLIEVRELAIIGNSVAFFCKCRADLLVVGCDHVVALGPLNICLFQKGSKVPSWFRGVDEVSVVVW